MIGYVMAAMAACLVVFVPARWLGIDTTAIVFTCWLTANLVFALGTVLARRRPPPRP